MRTGVKPSRPFGGLLCPPEYRGNALQTKMSALLIKRVLPSREYRHLFATVMPANLPSLISQFKQKMKIIALKQKYNNSWRYIFYRDLWVKEHFEEEETKNEAIFVSSLDLPRQLALLRKGYQGLGYRKTDAGVEILYGGNDANPPPLTHEGAK